MGANIRLNEDFYGLTELRETLPQVVAKANETKRPMVIARRSQPVAAIVDIDELQSLYDRMDASLRFPTRAAQGEPQAVPAPAPEAVEADSRQDFRGVVCPLNYVKTKLALEPMKGGQVLEVLLDDEGARNVPESVAREGHEVLAKMRSGDHWRVLIRKKVG